MALTRGKCNPAELAQAILILVTLLLCTTRASGRVVPAFRFLAQPDAVIYSDVGDDLVLSWSFGESSQRIEIPESKNPEREFVFGKSSFPGYVTNKILLVRGSVVTKRKSYKSKVDFDGNLSNDCHNCTANIKLFNLTNADFTTYGVSIYIYHHVHPLLNKLRITRRVPARINSWLKYMNTSEGNTTSLRCEAEGNPRPQVEIQHDNKTVAKGTGAAVYIIVDITQHHGGVYYCVIYPQDHNKAVIRDGMKLEVVPSSQKMSAPTTATSSSKWLRGLLSTIFTCLAFNLCAS